MPRRAEPTKKLKGIGAIESVQDRSRKIEEAVRLTWSSLESHLPHCHSTSPEGEDFHKTCVKEYARLIVLLSDLY